MKCVKNSRILPKIEAKIDQKHKVSESSFTCVAEKMAKKACFSDNFVLRGVKVCK